MELDGRIRAEATVCIKPQSLDLLCNLATFLCLMDELSVDFFL